jgi:LuxR family transcriptional regulator, maltose regulon positive regulatory protein
VTVLAPAGYGKTTVLAQWAGRDKRPFAWVSIDEEDNDVVSFLRCVASALGLVHPIDPSVFGSLRSRKASASAAVRMVTSALLSVSDPIVLVLDDIHLLRSRESARAVAALTEHVPVGSTLVLAGRALPRLPIARMRAAGRLFEIGTEQLALSGREVGRLAKGVGVELDAAEAADLTDRTEGWPVGTYLAVMSIKDGTTPRRGITAQSGRDRFLADYFDFEHLSRLSPKEVRFLTRTAILERMCGPLCDAVLQSTGAAGKLESLARSNHFVVPLDGRREWYRYHREFREFLQAELERREPELVPDLNLRAAAWYESQSAQETAIRYAQAAGDSARTARLVGALALPLSSTGRAATVEGWLGWFDHDVRLGRYPIVGVLGAWVYLLRGRTAAARRWLTPAEERRSTGRLPDGSASLQAWIAVIRAAMCCNGVEQMRADAETALRGLRATSEWRPVALLLRGVGQLLLGEHSAADESLAEAAETAESVEATTIRILALTERSLLAAAQADEDGAETLARQARTLVDDGQLGDDATSALAFAAAAFHGLRGGDSLQARADLTRANALAARLTHALPWYSVQTNLELGRADLALLDAQSARTRLSAADEVLRCRPQLGVLVPQLRELRAEAARVEELSAGRSTSLTAAELRLLPLLSTHLSFREIAQRLFVSRNTVKTQAISVYRKLGASSRSEAIAAATELGLLGEASRSADFTPSG